MPLRAVTRFVSRIALRLSTLFIAFLLVYLAWYWWDMKQLQAFCEEVHTGTPVSRLLPIADRYGISKKWLKGDGEFNDKTNQWSFYVPSAASAGSNVCAIHHDKVTVISAIVEID